MSQQRFIRCSYCGLPHQADERTCPVTGEPIIVAKPRRRPKPPPSEENYAWEHRVGAAGRMQVLDPDDLSGFVGKSVEGKYRIEELIGRGGMGAVYRAKNERIEKPVALKVMYRGYVPGSGQEERFLREARIAGSLGHPNIVEVFDLGHLDDGKPYQVMELLEGETLAERILTEGALPEVEVLDIAEQVLSALAAAHERGVVHRDLKPDNVFLIDREGAQVAKLLDFGVSKEMTDQSLSLTRTGVVVGTPYYLSPEQARGEPTIGPSIDVWAMGVLLYESITGVLPFNAPNYDGLLVKILETDPVAPSRFQPRLSPAIEAVILRALSRDLAVRPKTAREALHELRHGRRKAEESALSFRYPSFDLDGAGDSTIRDEPAPLSDDSTDLLSDRIMIARDPALGGTSDDGNSDDGNSDDGNSDDGTT